MQQGGRIPRRALGRAALGGMALGAFAVRARGQTTQADSWPVVSQMIFGDRTIGDGSAALSLDLPDRALDAALVPLTVGLPTDAVHAVTVVIDQNPSPLAAKFTVGPNAGVTSIATRVRVDDYTNVHAVGETADGALLAVRRFVKAAGGCSAPMVKEDAETIALGTMRFRQFAATADSALRQVQLIIRHPNNSGMQMDQLTRYYIPAHYITSVKLYQGDALIVAAETGISLSQNPELRISFRPNGAKSFRAEAIDNKGGHFTGEWPVEPTA